MGERWRVGGKLKRTLYRDEQLVGLVDTGEIAAEIVETMNRVGRLLDEVQGETARERSSAGRLPPGPLNRSLHFPDQVSRVDPYDSTKGQCADPWHDGVGVEEHQACPRCGDPYRWSCCGSTDPDHLPSRCGQRT